MFCIENRNSIENLRQKRKEGVSGGMCRGETANYASLRCCLGEEELVISELILIIDRQE